MLQLSENPLLRIAPPAGISIGRVESELHRLPHLAGDRRLTVGPTRRRVIDARKCQTAREAIGTLPEFDEATHLVIGGRFALWNFVPAIIEMAGPVNELWIATLGFSRQNIDELCSLIDAGQIARTWLLGSHYFKSTSAPIYDHAVKELDRRPSASFVSLRSHAKLLLLKMADGRTFTIESSANLRSCKNIEAATILGSPEVFAFHRRWILDLFAAMPSEGK